VCLCTNRFFSISSSRFRWSSACSLASRSCYNIKPYQMRGTLLILQTVILLPQVGQVRFAFVSQQVLPLHVFRLHLQPIYYIQDGKE
jgi:hypothetical protein